MQYQGEEYSSIIKAEYEKVLSYLADPGEARGCSPNSLVIN